jgi:hypothetical protein
MIRIIKRTRQLSIYPQLLTKRILSSSLVVRNSNKMTENLLHLKQLVENALYQHKSIRGIGIVDVNGVQVYFKLRTGLTPLLTEAENQEYASRAIDRHKNRRRFDGKTGGLEYGIVKYGKVIRGIIPITDQFYLLMAFDIEEDNFDEIISKKIVPLVWTYRQG